MRGPSRIRTTSILILNFSFFDSFSDPLHGVLNEPDTGYSFYYAETI